MPVFKSQRVLELGKARLLIRVEVALTGIRGVVDRLKAGSQTKAERMGIRSEAETPRIKRRQNALRATPIGQNQRIKPTEQVGRKNRRLDERRMKRAERDAEAGAGIKPENVIWILGSGRTGSTWLGRMMGDLTDHTLWHEPYVGEIFGSAYYRRAWERQRQRKDYILSSRYKQVWLRSMRDLILDGARARYPDADGYLVLKEPHGSFAAPLLMEALPESMLVFLVRDPRDVVASRLYGHRKGSWTYKLSGKREETLADTDPDKFVKLMAKHYLRDIEIVKEVYDDFDGRKALVKYESIRTDAFGELKKMYSKLGIPVTDEQLQRVVDTHDWEHIPEDKKGASESRRKASPGGWREDLSPGQAASVAEITAPILDEFYAE